MKKALFLVMILALSVFTTACINNLAVQELNNKAAEYMKKGDYENAISRLKSSVDLDSSIFETQYNLAVAYTENEDYEEAKEAFEKALELKPNSKDVYYSMAVMYENYAKDLYAGNTKAQKEQADSDDEGNKVNFNTDGKYKPSESEIESVKKYYNNSIDAYAKYLELAPNAEDSLDVKAHIEQLQANLETLDVDTN
ncbi:tetratricopeptide repeat protein [bacterium]|nr:tetratricopeptide repeat protein [bacterium]